MEEKSSHYLVLFIGLFLSLLHSGDSGTRTASSCNPDLAFLEELHNLEVAEGDLLQPGCRVSDQDATLKWFKDGQRLDSGAVNGIFINHLNQIIIPSFDERHEGNYTCVVYSGDMECIRSEASITFDPRSYFEFVPVNAYVNISDDHQFLCSPKENTWSVIWEKDGRPLEQGNLLIVGGNLYLTDIRDENVGKYTCVARDHFKRTKGRVHAWLYLTDPPQIDITTGAACEELHPPTHGTKLGGNRIGDFVIIGCDVGYQIQGEFFLDCQENGEWSHPLPTCVAES